MQVANQTNPRAKCRAAQLRGLVQLPPAARVPLAALTPPVVGCWRSHLAADLARQVVASQAHVAGCVDPIALKAVLAGIALKVVAGLRGKPGWLDDDRDTSRCGRSRHRRPPGLVPRVVQGVGLRGVGRDGRVRVCSEPQAAGLGGGGGGPDSHGSRGAELRGMQHATTATYACA